MTKKLDFPKLLERVLKFISLRPRSRKEILDYLKKKIPKLADQNQDLQDKVFKEIENLGLIDDTAFTYWWLEQRNTFRPKGKRALFYELKQKGIDNFIIEEVLAKGLDEMNLARQSGGKKWATLKNLPLEVSRQKLVGFLSRRGFSWEIIKKVLDEITEKR